MYVALRSSTCFEQHPAHPQEDKFYYYSGLQSALHLHTVGCLQRVTIPEAVVMHFILLRMSRVLLETCRGS